MLEIRDASREEVVCYYLIGELSRMVEHCDDGRPVDLKALGNPRSADEPALESLTRVLAADLRRHSWMYEVLWQKNLTWRLVRLAPREITVMPVGGHKDQWYYPLLNDFVQSILDGNPHREVKDPQSFVDTSREIIHPRLILTVHEKGRYAIVDGAHRASAQYAGGARTLEAYWGEP